MRDLLGGKLWYKVYLDENNADRAIVDLDALADILPHGSGYDDDWYVDVAKCGSVLARTEFHRMDENGSYNGWIRVGVRFFRKGGKGEIITRTYCSDPDYSDMVSDDLGSIAAELTA